MKKYNFSNTTTGDVAGDGCNVSYLNVPCQCNKDCIVYRISGVKTNCLNYKCIQIVIFCEQSEIESEAV